MRNLLKNVPTQVGKMWGTPSQCQWHALASILLWVKLHVKKSLLTYLAQWIRLHLSFNGPRFDSKHRRCFCREIRIYFTVKPYSIINPVEFSLKRTKSHSEPFQIFTFEFFPSHSLCLFVSFLFWSFLSGVIAAVKTVIGSSKKDIFWSKTRRGSNASSLKRSKLWFSRKEFHLIMIFHKIGLSYERVNEVWKAVNQSPVKFLPKNLSHFGEAKNFNRRP